MSVDTASRIQDLRRSWVLLQSVVALGIILDVVVVMGLTRRISPPLITIGLIYAGCLVLMKSRPGAGAIAIGAVSLLQLVLNLVDSGSLAESLSDPSNAGEFLMTAVSLVLSLCGGAGLIGLVLRAGHGAARSVYLVGGALLALALLASLLAAAPEEGSGGQGINTDTIDVEDNQFAPADVEVEFGTPVTWRWVGSNPHNVVAEGQFESEVQTVGTFSYTPDQLGTIDYFCTIHPFMKGTLTVVDGGAQP